MRCIGCQLRWPVVSTDQLEALQHRGMTHRLCETQQGRVHVPISDSWPKELREAAEVLLDVTGDVGAMADLLLPKKQC